MRTLFFLLLFLTKTTNPLNLSNLREFHNGNTLAARAFDNFKFSLKDTPPLEHPFDRIWRRNNRDIRSGPIVSTGARVREQVFEGVSDQVLRDDQSRSEVSVVDLLLNNQMISSLSPAEVSLLSPIGDMMPALASQLQREILSRCLRLRAASSATTDWGATGQRGVDRQILCALRRNT